jgi:hypothetical protein
MNNKNENEWSFGEMITSIFFNKERFLSWIPYHKTSFKKYRIGGISSIKLTDDDRTTQLVWWYLGVDSITIGKAMAHIVMSR